MHNIIHDGQANTYCVHNMYIIMLMWSPYIYQFYCIGIGIILALNALFHNTSLQHNSAIAKSEKVVLRKTYS